VTFRSLTVAAPYEAFIPSRDRKGAVAEGDA